MSWRDADLDLFLRDLFLALTELYRQLEFGRAKRHGDVSIPGANILNVMKN